MNTQSFQLGGTQSSTQVDHSHDFADFGTQASPYGDFSQYQGFSQVRLTCRRLTCAGLHILVLQHRCLPGPCTAQSNPLALSPGRADRKCVFDRLAWVTLPGTRLSHKLMLW